MELTQEYFDKGLSNILEKMVTKDELKIQLGAQTQELKKYTHEAFETQQQWMDERFKELIMTYDVRDRVTRLEKDVSQLKLARTSHS